MLFSDKDVRATYKYHTDRKWWDIGSQPEMSHNHLPISYFSLVVSPTGVQLKKQYFCIIVDKIP